MVLRVEHGGHGLLHGDLLRRPGGEGAGEPRDQLLVRVQPLQLMQLLARGALPDELGDLGRGQLEPAVARVVEVEEPGREQRHTAVGEEVHRRQPAPPRDQQLHRLVAGAAEGRDRAGVGGDELDEDDVADELPCVPNTRS